MSLSHPPQGRELEPYPGQDVVVAVLVVASLVVEAMLDEAELVVEP